MLDATTMTSNFELEVLGYVVDDYEAIHTIHWDLERDIGRTISEEDIFTALTNLVHAGLVDIFEYNPTTNTYSKIALTEGIHGSQFWFLANPTGIASHERHQA